VGYLGAILVVGAGALLLGLYGPRFTDTVGALLLSGLAAAAGGLGLVTAGGSRGLAAHRMGLTSARHHLAGALFAVAAASVAAAVGLLAGGHRWFAAGGVGLVAAVLGYVVLPTFSGAFAVGGLGVVLAVSTAAEVAEPTPLSVGTALVAAGGLMCLLSMAGPVRHRELGASMGAVVALAGAQQPLAEAGSVGWAYGLSLAVGLACFALYRGLPAVMLLVVGTLGVAASVLEATWDLTSGPARIIATLAATGATLMVMGALGTYLWRRRGLRYPAD
jgi:hypothetical protein